MNSSRLRNMRPLLLPALMIAVVVGTVIGALILMGSPAQERRHGIDSIRVQDLQQITGAINTFYDRNKRLPKTLAQLNGIDPRLRITDAETKQPYTYRALDQEEYELCATFETDTLRVRDSATPGDEYGVASRNGKYRTFRTMSDLIAP